MERLVAVKHTKRYNELRERVGALAQGGPVAAVGPGEAESLRLVIERLEALEQLIVKRSEF